MAPWSYQFLPGGDSFPLSLLKSSEHIQWFLLCVKSTVAQWMTVWWDLLYICHWRASLTVPSLLFLSPSSPPLEHYPLLPPLVSPIIHHFLQSPIRRNIVHSKIGLDRPTLYLPSPFWSSPAIFRFWRISFPHPSSLFTFTSEKIP